ERAYRRRVILSASDPRLSEKKFVEAPVIVANNDAKYQINKDRSKAYAQSAETECRLSVALDLASNEALQAADCDKAAKIRWLQYHDRDTADLCGMLPLAIGMPVALTQHLDRSEDKLLLRGRVGRVHSWLWPENNQYVKFEKASWQLDGASEPGLYPVELKKRAWFLDAKRKKPVLKVKRQQIPLVPAFAITAHASQGKTLAAALLDLNIDKRTDPALGTVAASRVRSRHDVLIMRPFPLWLFQRGAAEGPKLLLESLRGQEIDWTAYREARQPTATCKECRLVKAVQAFYDAEWSRVRSNQPATCIACTNKGKPKPGPPKRKYSGGSASFVCSGCKRAKIEDAFPRAQLNQQDAEAKRRCLPCLRAATALTCTVCKSSKPVAEFEASMVTLPAEDVVCSSCQERIKQRGVKNSREGWFTCKSCKGFFKAPPLDSQGQRQQYCGNCSCRSTRAANQQKCRSCGKMFQQTQKKGQPRVRNCPGCRRPASRGGDATPSKTD
ncbi:pfh1, partial [Symbiodinium necroappetens]